MNVSSSELANIQSHEGLSLSPYYDEKGYSIGTGHFTGIADIGDYSSFDADLARHGIMSVNRVISVADATALLQYDIQSAVDFVNANLKVPVSQTAFDALVDFEFGTGAAIHPIADINLKDYQSAANYIASWVHDSNGNVIAKLVPLRNATAQAVLADANYSEAGMNWIVKGIIILYVGRKILNYLKNE